MLNTSFERKETQGRDDNIKENRIIIIITTQRVKLLKPTALKNKIIK